MPIEFGTVYAVLPRERHLVVFLSPPNEDEEPIEWELRIPDKTDPDAWDWTLVQTLSRTASYFVRERKKPKDGEEERPEMTPAEAAEQTAKEVSVQLHGVRLPLRGGIIDEPMAWRVILERQRKSQKIPHIWHMNGPPNRALLRAMALLDRANWGKLFIYGEQPGYFVMVQDGWLQPVRNAAELQSAVGKCVHFGKTGYLSETQAKIALSLIDESRVRRLKTISDVPIVLASGKIVQEPGYNAAEQVFYQPFDSLPPVPRYPTTEQIQRAREDLWEPFAEFGWVGGEEHSGAGAIAAIFDQLMVHMIAGPRPLYVFDASAVCGSGSGKSLSASVVQRILTGRSSTYEMAHDAAEQRKSITSILLKGERVVVWDNVRASNFASPPIESLLTTQMWSDRLLSKNSTIQLPNFTTWMLTANGLTLNEDLARRSVLIDIEGTRRQQFKLNLETDDWLLANRVRLLHSALVMIQGWMNAGQPADPKVELTGFQQWSRIVGGLVWFAGLAGLPNCLNRAKAVNLTMQGVIDFFEEWAEEFGENPVSVDQVLKLDSSVYAVPQLKYSAEGRAQETTMSLWLRSLTTMIDGRFVVEVSPRRPRRYSLKTV